ncbi:MAG: ribonuclease Z [Planctomycetota bacterium]|nr:MAG: ribonuclease Z [Planctomycetota bacterium]
MQLHCLGTTGYHPSPTRHTACYYVPQWSVVLDAGTGFFRLTPLLLRDPVQRLTILLSHAHLDHIVGLTFLLDLLAVTQVESVRVVGQAVKLDAVRDHLFSQHVFPVDPPFEFCSLEDSTGRMQMDGWDLQWFPQEHPGGSLGFVLQGDGRKLAYMTDTVARPETPYRSLLYDCDLLLHECYFGDDQQSLAEKTGHSWLAGVTELVESIRPRQTALIHTNPLAEVIGSTIRLTGHQRDTLQMFVPDDEQVITF